MYRNFKEKSDKVPFWQYVLIMLACIGMAVASVFCFLPSGKKTTAMADTSGVTGATFSSSLFTVQVPYMDTMESAKNLAYIVPNKVGYITFSFDLSYNILDNAGSPFKQYTFTFNTWKVQNGNSSVSLSQSQLHAGMFNNRVQEYTNRYGVPAGPVPLPIDLQGTTYQGFIFTSSSQGVATMLNFYGGILGLPNDIDPANIIGFRMDLIRPIELPHQELLPGMSIWDTNTRVLTFTFMDNVGRSFILGFFTSARSAIATQYQSRVYYFENAYDAVKNESYEQGEQFGYNTGYDKGNEDGYTTGYNGGYAQGKQDGYSVGYNDGAENAGNFTFFSLFSAVIDAPVQAITGLLDFEVFGYNMKNFCFSLLTVCVIITIVKVVT